MAITTQRTAPVPDPHELGHRQPRTSTVGHLRRGRWLRSCQPMRPWR